MKFVDVTNYDNHTFFFRVMPPHLTRIFQTISLMFKFNLFF